MMDANKKEIHVNNILDEARTSDPAEAAVNAFSPDTVELKDGLAVGSVTYHTLLLRPLSARDLLESQDAAEKVVTTKDGLALIASPARLSRELLRRQVKCLTEDGQTHNGPLSLEELGRMSLRDMSALQAGAENMDAADALRAGEGMDRRGRNAGGPETA